MAWTYWGKPVPNFGDPKAKLLIVGLAPAAHGANRTGRMFTGDRSGDWLYRAMHKSGFANQPRSESADDGLSLHNALVTAVGHCAPPDNKPTKNEILNCENWLNETFDLTPFKVVIALGSIAWKACLVQLSRQYNVVQKELGQRNPKPKFGHGTILELSDGRVLIGSYHPSQQNTFTGRLTEEMFDQVFAIAKKHVTAEI
jgi:uracil-DNA glycosylase family 4